MPEEMQKSRRIRLWKVAALTLVAGTAMAQDLVGIRYPISELDIVHELNAAGVGVEASQVHLPGQISSTIASPKLAISAATPMGDNQVRLQLRCAAGAQCLPFFVILDAKDGSAEIRLVNRLVMESGHQSTSKTGEAPESHAQLRVGSHATLIIRDGHLNIHLPVLAIDSGSMGQQVRVCTLDRRKIFRATVTGNETVVGVAE